MITIDVNVVMVLKQLNIFCGNVQNQKKNWSLFNEWKVSYSPTSPSVNEYRDIYWVDDNAHVCKVKLKVMQELIQIVRPVGWNVGRVEGMSLELLKIEAYNKVIKRW